MTTTELNRKHSSSDGGFKVVLACEDNATGARALKLYQRLSARLSGSLPLSHSMWKFGALEAPQTRHTASRDADSADMIILALQGKQPLPGHVRSWLESCLERAAEQTRALVALMEQPTEEPEAAELCDYLRDVANRGQSDLFVHGPEHLQSSPTASWSVTYSSVPQVRLAAPESAAPQVSGWGINE